MITRRVLLGAVVLLASRCSSSPPPPPPPPVLTLNVIGGSDQNPDSSGQAAPVAVRLFQLSDPAKFERSDVFALTEHEQQTLGPESHGSEEFVLRPGESRTLTRELKKGVQFVGIAVLFRDIDEAHWRVVSPVAASGPTKLTLKINGLNANLA
jgi:type VI secretion system protein VasD